MKESSLPTNQFRRTVVVDIETVSVDPRIEKGALDALTGRIVCVGLLIDDGRTIAESAIAYEDEVKILTEFWQTIQPTDVLVGHNVLEFDLAFIRQRSWVFGIRPSRTVDLRKYYSQDLFDTMQVWTNWGFRKGASLDALAKALGCGGKTANGVDVATWWAIRDLDSIKKYCLDDVRLTYRVYCRLTYSESFARKTEPDSESATVAKTA